MLIGYANVHVYRCICVQVVGFVTRNYISLHGTNNVKIYCIGYICIYVIRMYIGMYICVYIRVHSVYMLCICISVYMFAMVGFGTRNYISFHGTNDVKKYCIIYIFVYICYACVYRYITRMCASG
jgi:hypothetical protein